MPQATFFDPNFAGRAGRTVSLKDVVKEKRYKGRQPYPHPRFLAYINACVVVPLPEIGNTGKVLTRWARMVGLHFNKLNLRCLVLNRKLDILIWNLKDRPGLGVKY